MTMRELSERYYASAEALNGRMVQLRAQLRRETDPAASCRLRSRLAELDPLLREMRALYLVTARYYDRGDHKNGSYCF